MAGDTKSATKNDVLLRVEHLKKYFPIEKGLFKRVIGYVKAVDDVSFEIRRGETLGMVGESGCGKTTLGRCVLRAIEPTEGSIHYYQDADTAVDIMALEYVQLRGMRKNMQMVFQDPNSSLNPRMTVLDLVGEPLWGHKVAFGRELENRVRDLIQAVGLDVKHLKRYPHAFSGGQRQRIGIARAIATNPDFIVADEPVSALDVSVQAQILNLLQDLQRQFNLTFLFIAHDLSVVEHISDRVSVMYVGKMVELAETEELFINPLHPYTEALLSAVPKANPRVETNRIVLGGEVPNPADPPGGCYFHPRCPYAQEVCGADEPPLREIHDGHYSACHFAGELALKGVPT
jgi:peptide/nickel transport system ATP-binding protein